jgi:hypothetical protein
LQEQPASGRSRRTLDCLQALQNDFRSDAPESACKQAVLRRAAADRSAASPVSVRPNADEQGDCVNEKGLQMQVFSEAAEGIRTLDLLHGKQ